MQEVVTTSSTTSFFPPTSQEILSPLTNQTKTSITLDWSQTRERVSPSLERRKDGANTASINQPAGPRKTSFTPSSFMHPRSSSDQTDLAGHNADRAVVGSANDGRWRLNHAGQLVDSGITPAEWDLADEIMRLKISPGSDMSPEAGEEGHVSPLETGSDESAGTPSPHSSDNQLRLITHSRGSSTDTTISSSQASGQSSSGQTPTVTLLVPKGSAGNEHRERPHSYSGGLSSADLRRLQQAGGSPPNAGPTGEQWPAANPRSAQNEQPTFPSVANYPTILPRGQQNQNEEMRSVQMQGGRQDDLYSDYNAQQRQYNPVQPHVLPRVGPNNTQAPRGRPNNITPAAIPYSPPQGGFNPQMQGLLPSPTSFAYPAPQPPPGSHLSLGNTQQMYEMMLHGTVPHESHPAVARVQQQHGVVRPPAHQHSASDPGATLRDPSALALLSNMQAAFTAAPHAPGVYPPAMAGLPFAPFMTPQQFWEMYTAAAPDLSAQAALAARLQPGQYPPQYPTVGVPAQNVAVGTPGVNMNGVEQTASSGSVTSPTSGPGASGTGPSANNRKLGLYKTELCRSWEEKGSCRYGAKCQFAHGEEEIRKVPRHPKYKTEICRTFWVSGSCPYGKRCCFIHTELPAGGVPPGADGQPPPSNADGRARSMSTNSDPNDGSNATSLLARISKKRDEAARVETSPQSPMPGNGRPPTGTLRVDTSSLGASVAKENKSAYPTFPTNGSLLPAHGQASAISPVPVTAGPDFGRHNSLLGQAQQRLAKNASTNNNSRHSFNGTDVNLDFVTAGPVSGHTSPFPVAGGENSSNLAVGSGPSRINGHMRSGSAGNWSSLSRNGHLAAPSPYSAAPETQTPSPWGNAEQLTVGGGTRRAEKSWV